MKYITANGGYDKKTRKECLRVFWWTMTGSNRRLPPRQEGTLPAELIVLGATILAESLGFVKWVIVVCLFVIICLAEL